MSLQRFSKKIGKHPKGRAMSDMNAGGLGSVLNPKIAYINVSQFLASGHSAIPFELNGALVVLFE